jgi:hypothetical protein
MPYGLHPANFHAQLAPDNTHGRGLEPVDSCARAIMQQRRDECRLEEKGIRREGMGNPSLAYDGWMERHRITSMVTKRLCLGGMTRRPEDALINSPRRRGVSARDL